MNDTLKKIKEDLKHMLPKWVYHFAASQKNNIKKKHYSRLISKNFNDTVRRDPCTYVFSYIEIETLNRCNNVCTFCPINKKQDTRSYAKMEESLFNKIIDELKSIEYDGDLALFSNNEPFLDERIEYFAELARASLPKAYIYIYTNGILLTMERFLKIIPHLSALSINNYNDNSIMNSTTKDIYKYCIEHPEIEKKVKIAMRKINEVLGTRGGQSPNNPKKETMPIPCLLPFNQMVIRPDGKVSFCCQDAFGKYTLGDVNNQTLMNIWQSEAYMKIRNGLKKGRSHFELCKYCDMLSTHPGAYKNPKKR